MRVAGMMELVFCGFRKFKDRSRSIFDLQWSAVVSNRLNHFFTQGFTLFYSG